MTKDLRNAILRAVVGIVVSVLARKLLDLWLDPDDE